MTTAPTQVMGFFGIRLIPSAKQLQVGGLYINAYNKSSTGKTYPQKIIPAKA